MISISNMGDFQKPAHLISTNQQIAIMGTGTIFIRYAHQVKPINYNLMLANVFMALSGGYQLYRKSQLPEELGGFWGKPVKK